MPGNLAGLIGTGAPLINDTNPVGNFNLSGVVITIPGTNITVDLETIIGGLNETAVNITLDRIIGTLSFQRQLEAPSLTLVRQNSLNARSNAFPRMQKPSTSRSTTSSPTF